MATVRGLKEMLEAMNEKPTNHECPKDGCSRAVPQGQLACRDHWFLVSKPTRDWVWRAYRSGNLVDHSAAIDKAVDEMNGKA